MPPPSPRRDVAAVALVAVAVQLAQRAWLVDDPSVRGPIIDGATFHGEALRLLRGEPAPHAPYWQSPWFVWLLAGTYRALGAEAPRALALQSACAVACALLVHALARRLELPRGAALAAGVCAALYGPLLFFSSQLIAAPLDAAAALLALLAACAVPPSRAAPWHLASGLALGFAVAQRGTVAPFALWSLALLARARGSAGAVGSLTRAGAYVAGAALAALPVAAGNYLRTGRLSTLTTNAGINLWLGNNPRYAETTAARPGWAWEWITSEPARHGVFSAQGRSAWFSDAARTWAFSHPLAALGAFARKLSDTLNGVEVPRNLDPYGELARTPLTAALLGREGLRFPFGLVLPLAALGARALWSGDGRDAHALRSALAFVALNAVGVALFLPAGRYRLALALALLPLAVEGARALVDAARRARPADPRGMLLALALLAFANLAPTFTGPDLAHEGPAQRAAALLAAGDPRGARAALEASLARRPATPDATDRWSDLGVACRALGDLACADAALHRAVTLEPRNYQAALRLGALRMERGDARGAADAFERCLRVMPMLPPAWEGLGAARDAYGDGPGAAHARDVAARLRAQISRAR